MWIFLSSSAPNNEPDTPYVASVAWNGEPLPKLEISFDALRRGGVLSFNMTSDSTAARRFFRP
jgi:putative alpha-1,2-mannosidase